jgi:benzoyl-CoA reductase subunit B
MSAKQLSCTEAAAAQHKRWFAQLRGEVFEGGRPYAIVQADMPFELFQVMGVPAVSNQWWAALIAAKQLAPAYLDGMRARGFHDGLCRYCSLGLAATMASDGPAPPWGGLPRPALLCARLTCDCVQRVFTEWARLLGAEFFAMDNPGPVELPARWWELSRHRWRDLVEPHRLTFAVGQLRALVGVLERLTGRQFDVGALAALMANINTQEEYFDDARRLICDAPYVPVRMSEQISNVMATQWVRGTPWAVSHARAFRDEVQARVDGGVAACPGERARLMWIGAGLWHDTSFYEAFEASHGAVFVWSMYLAFGPDGYIRYGLDDPLAALASRIASMNEYLHNPPWSNEWIVHEALRHRIDAALVLRPTGMRPAATGRRFVERALERVGIPVLPIEADVVDARHWNRERARRDVAAFLDRRVPTRGSR